MKTVSIVIPAYNEELRIDRCLKSLENLPDGSIKEILVIDNNSTDKTAQIAAGFKGVRVIVEIKKGVVWARTRGFKEATGDIVAFLDADTFISETWFARLTSFFENENLVCLSGPSFYYDLSAWERTLAKAYWNFATIFIYPIVGYMGNFANLAVRRTVFESIGGIDTTIEFYGDDTDVPRRLSKVGKVLFSTKFFVYASGRRFSKEGIFKTASRYALNFFSEVILRRPVSKGYTDVR